MRTKGVRQGGGTCCRQHGPAVAPKSAAGTLRLRPRFIDIELAPTEIRTIQGSARPFRFGSICHFDKSKAACAARVSVGYQVDPLHFTQRFCERNRSD